jgi:hypothetical protein
MNPVEMLNDESGLGHVPPTSVEMPRPTVAPLVVSLGLAVLAVGVVASVAMIIVGGLVLVCGLGIWIYDLLPGRGHMHEPLVAPELRAPPILATPGAVERLERGKPGYRLRMPEHVHPISAGVRGGLVGGLVMPVPALAYGVLSGHGIWYPVNLLAGMLLPGVGQMSVGELEQFRLSLLLLGIVIHVLTALVLGLAYGVLMPTLPRLHRPIAWGALLMPVLWTAASYLLMGRINPVLRAHVDWPWFIASQFIFGLVVAGGVLLGNRRHPVVSGLLGGIVGGLLMPLPAVVWSLLSGYGLWYPANLLAAMVTPGMDHLPVEALEQFHLEWIIPALVIHLGMSASFGMILGFLWPRLPSIPAPLAWGGLLLPVLWTAMSYGLMGVVNPLLQERVDWPWFVVSQFIFGITAAVVVIRSELVHIPPAGRGPDRWAIT